MGEAHGRYRFKSGNRNSPSVLLGVIFVPGLRPSATGGGPQTNKNIVT